MYWFDAKLGWGNEHMQGEDLEIPFQLAGAVSKNHYLAYGLSTFILCQPAPVASLCEIRFDSNISILPTQILTI